MSRWLHVSGLSSLVKDNDGLRRQANDLTCLESQIPWSQEQRDKLHSRRSVSFVGSGEDRSGPGLGRSRIELYLEGGGEGKVEGVIIVESLVEGCLAARR
jgi:hypothetical protein